MTDDNHVVNVLKKDRVALCTYIPKTEKKRPVKGMAARLKRLEGMVRDMMDSETGAEKEEDADVNAGPNLGGKVVTGKDATTYVGATHCMAMLEDVRCKTHSGSSLDLTNPILIDRRPQKLL